MNMDASFVLGAVLIIGPVLLIGCIAYGVFGFSPERAQAIRSAEADTPVVLEEIRRIHIRSPDRFRHDRLDRHPAYVGGVFAAWGYSWCVFSGQILPSNVSAMSNGTRETMAVSLIVGSTLALVGSSMGARLVRWRFIHGIHDNLTSSMLADDIRLPYTFGSAGLFSVAIGFSIYAQASFSTEIASVGGWMTGVGALWSAALIGMFYTRIRRYDRTRTVLIDEAVAQIERGHGTD